MREYRYLWKDVVLHNQSKPTGARTVADPGLPRGSDKTRGNTTSQTLESANQILLLYIRSTHPPPGPPLMVEALSCPCVLNDVDIFCTPWVYCSLRREWLCTKFCEWHTIVTIECGSEWLDHVMNDMITWWMTWSRDGWHGDVMDDIRHGHVMDDIP